MTSPILAVIFGLILLLWSADRFVEGAASVARHFGVPALLIGMVIVGFGTSAPEMLVSALASLQGNPGIALGNAYGSNITNIALIIGITAVVSPIAVQSGILKKELPVLLVITLFAAWQLLDGKISRIDGVVLLGLFAGLMGWSIWQGIRTPEDNMGAEFEQELNQRAMAPARAAVWLVIGLLVLIASSRLLVWGAVEIAEGFGVSDLMIGLTVIAIGTSLPELASSLMAARKREHDIALGSIVGSNMFNTLAVVGIAGTIHPMAVEPAVLSRDLPVMTALTVSLFIFGYGWRRGQGRISRYDGAILLTAYIA
ncbi:MAG: calcium/sodium antiporter, partial [Wenzhouxiangella sp.]|nr:calcium/sodium antiporter [Wenzhouxiangella sp.]